VKVARGNEFAHGRIVLPGKQGCFGFPWWEPCEDTVRIEDRTKGLGGADDGEREPSRSA
jgi:hypothetical protein